MNKKVQDYIVESTCSVTLRKAFMENDSILSEMDLIQLSYYAKYYNKRLELIKLLFENKISESSKKWLNCYIDCVKKIIEAVQKQEDDCIYEIKIKETTISYEESYLSKTYNGAI